jgi:hypothetical protein
MHSVTGDADAGSRHALDDPQSTLMQTAPLRILIDLASITFAGVALMSFFAQVASDAAGPVILCRPTNRTVKVMLTADGVHLLRVTDNLPQDWIDPITQRASAH